MRRFVKPVALVSALFALLVVSGYGYYRHEYPYGWSHCCDKQLMFALHQYAEDHDGAYPTGEATPEASLSLLYPKYVDADLLRGKTVPLRVVAAKLERGQPLTANTCGWNYVHGLTLRDDRRLALLWGKEPLNHNGGRTSDGGRTVLSVNLGYEYVEGPNWDRFLAEQKELLSARDVRNIEQTP